ncbi:hypothetical protein [Halococcus sp. IIIV-5B]|uniref:hypothetical protein n=1 Tax=Halococcus sp. IIIV-5B TaxID=2321230 RepID=UPI0018F2AEBD|nr:hypothetical protein [Halococcus sp. IIIV-5B]
MGGGDDDQPEEQPADEQDAAPDRVELGGGPPELLSVAHDPRRDEKREARPHERRHEVEAEPIA